ncbi:MAG: hypothetical protein ACSLEL_05010 [Candidatus Malihini olakiniferum]
MKGGRLSHDKLRTQFEQARYRNVNQIMENGELVTRDILLDLFPVPVEREKSYRIDFFDEDVDSLGVFDADSQCMLQEESQKLACCPRI